jgi:hypothetical protein
MLKHALFSKVAYVSHCPGHKNSKGELAEWCVKSHEDGHIISSHGSQEAAKKHLQDMHAHSGSLEPKLAASLQYWPTKMVLALATLLITGGGVSALKGQVAQELQSRGQEVPAALRGDATMTVYPADPSDPPIVDQSEQQPAQPAPKPTQRISPEPNATPPTNIPGADPNRLIRASRKRAYGYYNFEWQGNDALLLGPDKRTMLLSGKAARDFQNELERVEDEIPHDKALELAVNDLVKKYFEETPKI